MTGRERGNPDRQLTTRICKQTGFGYVVLESKHAHSHIVHTPKKERVRLAISNPSPSQRPGARTRSRSWQGLARQSSPDHTKFAHSLVRSQVLSVKWRECVTYLGWLRALWARLGFTTSRRWRGSSGFRLSRRSRTLTTATSSRGGAFATTASGSVLATTAT